VVTMVLSLGKVCDLIARGEHICHLPTGQLISRPLCLTGGQVNTTCMSLYFTHCFFIFVRSTSLVSTTSAYTPLSLLLVHSCLLLSPHSALVSTSGSISSLEPPHLGIESTR